MPPNIFNPNQTEVTLDLDSLHLIALPQSVPLARLLACTCLQRWGLDHLIGQVSLVVSEYAANAVRHTGPQEVPDGYAALHDKTPATYVVRLRRTATHLVAEVSDTSPEPPVLRIAGAEDEDGRGLMLVQAEADRVGWYPNNAGGKVVWASWDLPAVLSVPHPAAVTA